MKKSNPAKQPKDMQTPQAHGQDATPYPLDLVANIAMQMILGGRVLERPGDSGVNTHKNAALLALSLLDDCDKERLHRKEWQEQQTATFLHDAEVRRKFPDGMPLPEAMRYITDAPSETDAIPLFRRWLCEDWLADWTVLPAIPASEGAVDQFIANARKNNFSIFEDSPGIPPVFTLNRNRDRFRRWKEHDYIPAVKRANAQKRKRK